jgi:hypothetical protein
MLGRSDREDEAEVEEWKSPAGFCGGGWNRGERERSSHRLVWLCASSRVCGVIRVKVQARFVGVIRVEDQARFAIIRESV